MTLVWSSIALGAVYAIVAIGYNIVFIASRVFNFAQAQFVMIGAYVAVVAGTTLGLPLPVALLLCAIVGAVLGMIEEFVAVRWLYTRDQHNVLVTTLGAATILSGVALVTFGSQPRTVPYFDSSTTLDLLGGRVGVADLLVIAVAAALAILVALITRRTTIGLTALAAAEDRSAAMLRGINVRWLAVGAFALAGAALAVAGPVVASKTYVNFDLGDNLAVKGFVVLAIGGYGSQTGAIIGGLAVGFLEIFAARYLGSDWRNVAVFVVLLVIMAIRPHGIFGRAEGRTV